MVEVLRSRRSPLLRALTGLVALVVALLPTTAQAVRPTLSAAATAAATFTNPIRQHVSDPYVIRYGGYYYMTSTDGCDAGYLCVWKSATISGFASAAKYDVFRIPGGQSNSAEVWAPEIHYAQGHFYIYYTATTAGVGSAHRLFVLQATGDDPTGSYTEADTGYAHGQLHESSDLWAIDPTVFTGSDGKLYIAWSGWPTSAGGQQAIYLAPMSDPLHISGDRVQISAPTRPWETVDNPDSPSSGTVGYFPVNEGPEAFQHGGRTYITFSASFCGTRSYAVGLLTNTGGTLLSSSSWTKTGPIFKYHGDVVGSASFEPITSPDGTEDWFLVHSSTAGCDAGRELRAQRLYWDARDGSPLLGYP
ncbi:glycoside hydrolase family 43 protein, partial [Streptomyces carpinensis]